MKIKTVENNSLQMRGKNPVRNILGSEKISLLGALVVMIVIFSSLSPNFFTPKNFLNILIAASLVGLVAVGESFLVIAGQVDLSPGSVAAFCGVLTSMLVAKGFGTFWTLLIVIIIGLAIGYLNSLAVNGLNIEPFIATLASMSVFRGLAYILCDGKPVFIQVWFIDESNAAKAKAIEMGVKDMIMADARMNPDTYLAALDNMIAQGVDGLLICVPDQKLSTAPR